MAATALVDRLRQAQVTFELLPHRRSETSSGKARALGVLPQETAKTVVVRAGRRLVRVVLPASERLDLGKLQRALGEPAELVHESELAAAYPEFELGAVPPFGGRSDQVVVDWRLTGAEWVVFEAGAHDESVRLRSVDLLDLAEARLVDVVQDEHR